MKSIREQDALQIIQEKVRVCVTCGGDPQPIENFYFRDKKKGIRYRQCKTCWNKRTVKWRLDNPELFDKAQENRRIVA